MANDHKGRRNRHDPDRGGIFHCQPDREVTLGNIEHEDESASAKTCLANRIGHRGMTRAGIAKVHAFDEARDPDGEGQRPAQIGRYKKAKRSE